MLKEKTQPDNNQAMAETSEEKSAILPPTNLPEGISSLAIDSLSKIDAAIVVPNDYASNPAVLSFAGEHANAEGSKEEVVKNLYALQHSAALESVGRNASSLYAFRLQKASGASNRAIMDFLAKAGHKYSEGDISKLIKVGKKLEMHPRLREVTSFNKVYEVAKLSEAKLAEVAKSGKIGETGLNEANLQEVKKAVALQIRDSEKPSKSGSDKGAEEKLKDDTTEPVTEESSYNSPKSPIVYLSQALETVHDEIRASNNPELNPLKAALLALKTEVEKLLNR